MAAQQEILRRHAVPDFDSNLRLKNFPAFTREFWDWRESDLAAPPDELSARLPEYGETLRPTWVVRGGKGQPENLILVEELPWGTDFDKTGAASEEHRWHASPQARFERLLRETGVAIGLLISPERKSRTKSGVGTDLRYHKIHNTGSPNDVRIATDARSTSTQ